MRCERCQATAPDAQHCPACGARLVAGCPRCGAVHGVGHSFCKCSGAALVVPNEPPRETAGSPAAAADHAAPLVLVADDQAAVRDLVSEILAEAGFRTVRASDGSEVLPLAVQYRPALIVLDIVMPRLDGYTTMTRLRNNRSTRDIPIIILTGQPGPLYQTLSFGLGATAHLTKPFSPRQLMDTVAQLLRNRAG